MANNHTRIWTHRTGEFELGMRTLIMGVLNVTPDSFSDGGRYFSIENAVQHAQLLQKSGADILDIGAESTRPGSTPVSDAEQLERLLPILKKLKDEISIPISVDTTSAVVAESCITAGASIVNDISGFRRDAKLPELCANSKCGVVLMHIKGTPETMQRATQYHDVIEEIAEYLQESCRVAIDAGVANESIIVDPGIGFGKSFEQNYQLLAALSRFKKLALGVLVGTSRKAFTGEFSGLPADQRQFPTAATVAIAVLKGADIVRVHDVSEMKQVADICDRYRKVNNEYA